ncbi:MAG TPA: DUF177 domain-containing protein [Bdellovibrionota bacterium]|nr:DUF177 domain-containing protein [Bdellovibrionota bacterium]
MRINIHEIPPDGLSFLLDRSKVWIDDLVKKSANECGKTFQVDLDVFRSDDNVIFRGNLKADLVLPCSRCGESFVIPVDRQFTSTYCKGRDGADQLREEFRLSKGDLDLTFFAGEEVDLSTVINEQLVLAIPYRPLCKEECKGLCPYCGKNLNEGDCRCEKGSWSLKFSALLDLKREQSVEP